MRSIPDRGGREVRRCASRRRDGDTIRRRGEDPMTSIDLYVDTINDAIQILRKIEASV
jgi:hypothetical protein